MATVTSGRGKSAISVSVEYKGFFFLGNPVGRLHLNIYSVLRDEGAFGVGAVRQVLAGRQRQFGGGGIKGQSWADLVLADEVTAQPVRRRSNLNRLVVSANYGPHPFVRKYNRWIEDASLNRPHGRFRGYHIYRQAARLVQSHIDGRLGPIADQLVKGLT